eukprot:scaffold296957_cov14-Tisochrysis_lutea.AAC.2
MPVPGLAFPCFRAKPCEHMQRSGVVRKNSCTVIHSWFHVSSLQSAAQEDGSEPGKWLCALVYL